MPRHLAVSALACWLLAELLGAYMLSNWVRSGAARRRREEQNGMSLPVLAAHAGLNLAGMACWIGFVASGWTAAAWLALCFMVPAIGLGVSTVSIWTPYPVRGHAAAPAGQAAGTHAGPEPAGRIAAIPDTALARALDDEAAASRLVDDLLARNLTSDTDPRRPFLDPRALVPFLHGVLAIATFMLATLAAIGAS
ncbi:MAG TPA: hypothetical protein VEL03_11350 [Streptosporangiaceae bacterium]|nr:hypothetical protein [Streptosporangiaceae bacterium]